jgi:hypothetical protein
MQPYTLAQNFTLRLHVQIQEFRSKFSSLEFKIGRDV